MSLAKEQILAEIDAIFASFGAAQSVLSPDIAAGKMYEALVLSRVLKQLHEREGFQFRLVNGTKPVLKSSPGPINAAYPHFVGTLHTKRIAVWTDIEFSTLSYALRNGGIKPESGDRHELDIVVVPADTISYPAYSDILWGIECKHTPFEKHMARAALGVRRELSLLAEPTQTAFRRWPRTYVPAQPPSVLSVYSTSPAVTKYRDSGSVFGVDFAHLELPR